MIRQPTVFLLGAGASIPYGLPSGAELRDILCQASFGINQPLPLTLHNILGINPVTTVEFATAFMLSGQVSIDAFLARRTEHVGIGKLCIAAELCQREVASRVTNPGKKDDWYSVLWHALASDAARLDELRSNRVWFITFNYDRSLEYFLFQAIKHTYGVADADALATVQSFGILHLYGALGNFAPNYANDARPYKNELTRQDLEIAATGLKIIPEARDSDPGFYNARDLVSRCRRLCILGFGFDELNISRLNLPAALSECTKWPTIVASRLGKTEAEMKFYTPLMLGTGGAVGRWGLFNDQNTTTIRESGILL